MESITSNYFGLSDDFSSPENSRVTIVPVPHEATTSYGKGTKHGPAAILKASQQVELFDEELWIEPYKIGVQTLAPIEMPVATAETEKPFQELREVVAPIIEFGKFPLIVGGEHSLTLGSVAACADRYENLSILQIDAHADCRESYEGNPYSHASVAYHIYKGLPQPIITQGGVRNICAEEIAWLEEEKPRINIFWARNQDRWNYNEIISTLSDNVYLSIDLDGLDCGIMPSTGTPEPGGLGWYQLMDLIKVLCVRKNVVAADIVELAPIKTLHAPDFLAAKLMYKLIGYKFALELGVSKRYL